MGRYCFTLLGLLILFTTPGFAQKLLDKSVSLEAKKRKVKDVLDIVGKRGGFSFSYNSTLVPNDSLVTVTAITLPVRQILQMMFAEKYQYKEVDNHIIILPAETEKWFTISGYITDAISGARIPDVSVIERQQLSSTLSNHDGYFRLKIKDKGKYSLAEITFSKGVFYTDTSLTMFLGFDQEISIQLAPSSLTMPEVMITQYGSTERSWFGKFLISSKLRQQSANLGKFFVDKPVQASLLPGLGTHGKLSSQVTNKFSFNILGGYTAGVDGFELGGMFNINKKDVRWAQVGGIFNIVNGGAMGAQVGGIFNIVKGEVKGVQVGGIFNKVGHSVRGVEIAGIANNVSDSVKGVQIAGMFNRARCIKGLQIAGITNLPDKIRTHNAFVADTVYEMHGTQIAGISNVVHKNSKGVQISGIINITRRTMKGVQISGICNRAGRMDGTQIALINIADTLNGYSIGLVNIVRKGYHSLAVSSSDLSTVMLSYKTGTKRLYSILSAGANLSTSKTDFIYGFGIGTEMKLSRSTGLSTEFSLSNLYRAATDNNALLLKIEPAFNWNIGRKFTLYTGPSIYFIPYVFSNPITGAHAPVVPMAALYDLKTDYNTAMWIGWQVGFHIF